MDILEENPLLPRREIKLHPSTWWAPEYFGFGKINFILQTTL
jgi:hypothetical protein